jgi:hypothetical protein
MLRAIERLNRIKYFIDSFVLETEPLILSNSASVINTSKEELKQSINELIASRFTNEDHIQSFFDRKSKFIQLIFEIITK